MTHTPPSPAVLPAPMSDGELLTQALAIEEAAVKQLGFDLLRARTAANDGLANLTPHLARLSTGFPGFELRALASLPRLTQLAQEQQRAVQTTIKHRNLDDVLPEALKWRRKLLTLAQSLAEAGAVKPEAVTAIVKGSGALDNAQDVLDLAALLAPHKAKVESIHGPGALDAARAAGQAAIDALGAGRDAGPEVAKAADLRDRYATLIVRLHERLRSAMAAVTSYPDATELVPPLHQGPKGGKAPAEPAPTAPNP